MKLYSEDSASHVYSFEDNGDIRYLQETKFTSIKTSKFIVCSYEGSWWIGMIFEKDTDEINLKEKFIHPHGPFTSFKWPIFDDISGFHVITLFPLLAFR